MPLFQLKKREAAPAAAPAWHPNFRNFDKLPDTKVVRTNFFINVAAIALAVVLLGVVGWREYQVSVSQGQTQIAQEGIDQRKKQSDEGVRLTRQFGEQDKKFAEAAAFTATPIRPTELLAELGASLPAEIQLDSIDFRPGEPDAPCILRGTAAGTKDQASGAASAYVDTLRARPRFAQVFKVVELKAITPDTRTGLLSFEIVMKTKPAGGKKP